MRLKRPLLKEAILLTTHLQKTLETGCSGKPNSVLH